jgi:hypothetical protein
MKMSDEMLVNSRDITLHNLPEDKIRNITEQEFIRILSYEKHKFWCNQWIWSY